MKQHKKEVIIPIGGAKPLAPYSPGMRIGNLVFTSEQIGIDPEKGGLVTGGLEAETNQALQNAASILEAAGSSLASAIKVTVYLKEIEDYGLVNEVYTAYFMEDPPARSIIQGKLPAGALVGFDVIAYAN